MRAAYETDDNARLPHARWRVPPGHHRSLRQSLYQRRLSQVGFRIQALRSRLSNEAALNRLSIKDHREMLKLIKAREVEPLQKLLRAHIHHTRQMYLDVLERRALAEEKTARVGWLRKRAVAQRGGIRTPGTLASTPHFECGAFNHSATSPRGLCGAKRPPVVARYVAGQGLTGNDFSASWPRSERDPASTSSWSETRGPHQRRGCPGQPGHDDGVLAAAPGA